MGKPEANVENYLRRRVAELQGQIRKCKWIGRSGAPDNYLWFSGGRYAFAECKAEGESVDWRSHQGRELRRMHDDGIDVYVVASHAEVDAMLERVMNG